MNDTAREGAFLDLEFPVEVWLASERIPLDRLLRLEPGGMLKLTKGPDEPVDLVVNGSVVARGELVVVDGHFGFRVTGSSRQGLDGLGDGSGSGDEAQPAVEQDPAEDAVAPDAAPEQQEAES